MRPEYRPPPDFRANKRFAFVIGLVVFALIGLFQSISFYVESLWFESLGYESVFWYRLQMQALVFLAFGGASALLLWILLRLVTPASTRMHRMEIGKETIVVPSAQTLRGLLIPVSIIFGLFFGISFSSDWNQYALFFNQPAGSDVIDPIFGKPLSFYFFTLPVLESVAGWLVVISVIVLVAAIVLTITDIAAIAARFKPISFALSILLLSAAFWTYVRRYGLILEDHNLFSGVRYVDDHVILPASLVMVGVLVVGAIIAAANVRAGLARNIGLAVALPVLTYVVAGGLIPGYVSNFVVRPNELVRETPYIRNNIQSTRKAFGVDNVETVPFQPRVTNAVFDPAQHADTLDNIRLWDWRALQATLRQIQEIRTYYEFFDVDVDRYMIGGKLQAVMLATRELNLNKLPTGSRNWLNERLIYTHGYGVTMNPVSRFTREGQPQLILSNTPVQSATPDIQLTRPEIYYGELTNWPVYVKTGQEEFNFPEGDANNYSTYEGTGGIRMGSLPRQLLLAWTLGDITRVPFSDDITPDSRLLMRRNIRERAAAVAPFLVYDEDPYVVVGTDGRLYWIMDAFIMSSNYPYSRHITMGNRRLNYIRNSVKVVVDAYNGNVDFYIFEPEDPFIQAYDRMFPNLFKTEAEMPSFLRAHVRYPELLFQIQAMTYSTYHVENEQVFYNREDIWSIALQGRAQTGQQASDAIEAFYVLMRFPEEQELEFVAMLPFTPSNRNNLIGWIAARSDGANYGTLRAYQFPKTGFVDGPLQVQARIDQDPQLSSQFTLWNQQGSTVIRGNLLVLPLGDTLLYAEPVYLQADRSPMPELRMVVLATQDRLAYGSRFPEALSALLQGQVPQTLTETTSGSPPPAGTSPTGTANAQPGAIPDLIDRANRAVADYQRLTAEGKLGEAGLKLDELKRVLEEMNRSR